MSWIRSRRDPGLKMDILAKIGQEGPKIADLDTGLPGSILDILPKVWYQKKALDELNQIPLGPRPENGYFGQKWPRKATNRRS